jgi:FAD/FMN-containing dehydrogenase
METGTPVRPAPQALPRGLSHSDDKPTLQRYTQDRDVAEGHLPRAVIKPRDTAQVQALVQWANQHRVGLVPVASGGPRRRGDTVPAQPGTVIVDLGDMQRLVHADARDKISIIEPGLTFGTIDRLLEPHGLRAYKPLAPRAGKSVLASYLEREPLIAANDHWDSADPFGGTQLVLGDGRIALTGSAAHEGTLAEQLANGHRQMVPTGPTNIDLLRVVQGAQGSLGIMTWAAVYCERLPSRETALFCSAGTLAPVIALATELLRRRLGNTLFIVDRVQLALLLAADRTAFDALCPALPAWTAFVGLSAGRLRPDEKMAWQQADLLAIAQRSGTTAQAQLGHHRADNLLRALHAPQPVPLRDRALGPQRELFFIQQLHHAERFVQAVRDMVADGGGPLGVCLQPMAQGVNCHVEFTQPLGPETAQRPAHAQRWQRAAERCADAGAFFSRPYGSWARLAFDRDPAGQPLRAMTKALLDPQQVMNPGRLPY